MVFPFFQKERQKVAHTLQTCIYLLCKKQMHVCTNGMTRAIHRGTLLVNWPLAGSSIHKRPPCNRPYMFLPCSRFLARTRFGGGTTPAEPSGDPDLPGLRHDRRRDLLHRRPGVGRRPASSRGHRWRHSRPRRGPGRLESSEGEGTFWLVVSS